MRTEEVLTGSKFLTIFNLQGGDFQINEEAFGLLKARNVGQACSSVGMNTRDASLEYRVDGQVATLETPVSLGQTITVAKKATNNGC